MLHILHITHGSYHSLEPLDTFSTSVSQDLGSQQALLWPGTESNCRHERQPQTQGVIPSVMAFCKPAQLLPVLPKAKPKSAPTNIQFWHKAGTFFFRSINKGQHTHRPRGDGCEVSIPGAVFFAYKKKKAIPPKADNSSSSWRNRVVT